MTYYCYFCRRCFHDSLFIIFMNGTFLRKEESGSYLDSRGSENFGSSHLFSATDTARRNYRHIDDAVYELEQSMGLDSEQDYDESDADEPASTTEGR